MSSFDLDFEKVGNDSYFLTGGTPFEKLNIDWLAPNMLLPGFDPFWESGSPNGLLSFENMLFFENIPSVLGFLVKMPIPFPKILLEFPNEKLKILLLF